MSFSVKEFTERVTKQINDYDTALMKVKSVLDEVNEISNDVCDFIISGKNRPYITVTSKQLGIEVKFREVEIYNESVKTKDYNLAIVNLIENGMKN